MSGAAALHPIVAGCGLYAPQVHEALVEKPSSHSARAVGLHPGQAGIALISCSSEGTCFSFGTTQVIRQQPRVQVIMKVHGEETGPGSSSECKLANQGQTQQAKQGAETALG